MSAKKIGKTRQEAPPPKSRFGWVLAGGVALVVVLVAALIVTRQGAPQQAATQPGTAAAGPRLAVDQTEIDFGKVPLNKTVRADFKLSNAGSQSLQILGEPLVELAQGC